VRVHSTKILELQRRWLIGTNRSIADLDEEIVHKHLNYLDHEEERLDLR
jgi:monovalent cation/hydrogen antiporter